MLNTVETTVTAIRSPVGDFFVTAFRLQTTQSIQESQSRRRTPESAVFPSVAYQVMPPMEVFRRLRRFGVPAHPARDTWLGF